VLVTSPWQLRGHKYAKPIETMRDYLDGMDAAAYASVPPAVTSRVLAALGPRMLGLAARRCDGTLLITSRPNTLPRLES